MNNDALLDAYHQSGGVDLRNQVVEENLPLVHHVARKLHTRTGGVEYEDLVSAGILGLMDAVENFDPGRGWAFSTYAAPRIRGAILDDLRRKDHATRSIRKKERDIARTRERLRQRLEREPRDQEVARELGVGLETLWDWEGTVVRSERVSLDRTLAPDDPNSATAADILADDNATAADEALGRLQEAEVVQEAIATLSKQERTVLSLYYFEELNLREVGQVMELTESRISQIRTKALGTLRSQLAHLSMAGGVAAA